jgi:hypothetical protein
MIRSAASSETSIGFSIMTCFPASNARTASSACVAVGVEIDSASMPGSASTASRSVV